MIASVMDLGSMPSIAMSWSSQTACSSAVRMADVCARHSPTMRSPSTTPNLMLVLLALMASSILGSPLGRAAQQFTRHDLARAGRRLQQQRALAVEAGEPAAHQLRAQPDVDFGADGSGLGEPRRAHGLEAFAAPFVEPRRQGCRELLQGSFDRTT